MVGTSVILITIRSQPHFSWFFDGLGRQVYRDFEVIVVDDSPSTERYKECLVEAQKNRVNLAWYGKSKPSPWHGKRPALCNARNTGLVVANGEYVAFHDDNGWAMPNWLVRHQLWAMFGLAVGGSWFTMAEGYPLDGRFVGNIGPYGWEFRRAQIAQKPMIANPEWLHGGNMGFPLKAALSVNGYDEMYDGEQGVDDCDFGIRIRRAGYKIAFDPDCFVYYSLKTHNLTQDEVEAVKPDKAKLERERMSRKPKEKLLRDGKMHFSNEFLIQELGDKPDVIRANPHFNLAKLREEWRKTGKIEHPPMYERDWRDGQVIVDMI